MQVFGWKLLILIKKILVNGFLGSARRRRLTCPNSFCEYELRSFGHRMMKDFVPERVRTEEENERLLAELADLDQRHDELTPEEREYAELLTVLVESFEDAHYALKGSTPDSRLRSLIEEHGLRQRDLPVGSAVVSGKRAISKAQAKKLAARFHVAADLFL